MPQCFFSLFMRLCELLLAFYKYFLIFKDCIGILYHLKTERYPHVISSSHDYLDNRSSRQFVVLYCGFDFSWNKLLQNFDSKDGFFAISVFACNVTRNSLVR